LPEPDTPVTTISSFAGSDSVRFLRLFWRAPRMTMASAGYLFLLQEGNCQRKARILADSV
jgi:hypothetical protein